MAKDAFRHEVALRLKEARRERALTQRQLADLGHSTQQNISRYEKGFIPDSWFLLARLHVEKAIDLNWLLGVPAAALAEEAPAGNGGARAPIALEPARVGEAAVGAREVPLPGTVPASAEPAGLAAAGEGRREGTG